MRMIVVTGGAGFIGSACVWRLNQAGRSDVMVVDVLDSSEKWKNLVNRSFEDYMDHQEFIERLGNGRLPTTIEAIIHMGACSATTERNADFLMRNNTLYTRTIAQWALQNKVRFVYASSGATYGEGESGYGDDDAVTPKLKPINMYGYSKHLFDLWALRRGMLNAMVGLKFFNVYGPNEYHKEDMRSVVHKAFGQISQTGRLSLFQSYRPEYAHGEQVRDFVYVKDVVEVIFWMLEHPECNGLYNVGTGVERSWNALARAVFQAMQRPEQIEYIPMPEALRGRYQYRTQADITKLRTAGYQKPFHTLEEGIADYVGQFLLGVDFYL
jgi:ADP-L-glycero-D-manno-heptose 6-epimerase